MSNQRILFGGGGDERESRPLDEIFANWIGSGRMLYLPTALVHPSNIKAGVRWIKQVYAPLGIHKIEAWENLPANAAAELASFDAVYIGGGNTFYLLQQLRRHKLDLALDDFIQQGKPVFGGSAGAIVLGYDISSCAHIDENIIGLTDFSGMDLALGYTIWCHYTPEEKARIRAYVDRTGVPSVAISERSGVSRESDSPEGVSPDGDHLYARGYEPVVHFTHQGQELIEPGARIV